MPNRPSLRAELFSDWPFARIVELRFFSGLSVEDTAEVMGVSDSTTLRWAKKTKRLSY